MGFGSGMAETGPDEGRLSCEAPATGITPPKPDVVVCEGVSTSSISSSLSDGSSDSSFAILVQAGSSTSWILFLRSDVEMTFRVDTEGFSVSESRSMSLVLEDGGSVGSMTAVGKGSG